MNLYSINLWTTSIKDAFALYLPIPRGANPTVTFIILFSSFQLLDCHANATGWKGSLKSHPILADADARIVNCHEGRQFVLLLTSFRNLTKIADCSNSPPIVSQIRNPWFLLSQFAQAQKVTSNKSLTLQIYKQRKPGCFNTDLAHPNWSDNNSLF